MSDRSIIDWDHASILVMEMERMAEAHPHAYLQVERSGYFLAGYLKDAAALIRLLAPPKAINASVIPF